MDPIVMPIATRAAVPVPGAVRPCAETLLALATGWRQEQTVHRHEPTGDYHKSHAEFLYKGAYRALCTRCAKSWPFSTTGSSVSSED